MKRFFLATLLFGIAHLTIAQDAPERPPGYDNLEQFVGRWTVQGNEKTFLEVCDWFDGKFHIVCNAERNRPDGTVGRSPAI